jgi:sn-glycerol 3-phosphate transport system permease protein
MIPKFERSSSPTLRDVLSVDLKSVLHQSLLFGIVALLASPLLFALIVSTQSITQIYDVTNLSPGTEFVANYTSVLVEFNMLRYIWNSLIMSVIVVVAKITLSLLAALALVYYDFRFKNLIFLFILFTLMLPVPVRIIPLFELMVDMGWSNTLIGLTGPYIASATAVFLLRQHFRSLPESYVEVARLDGVGPLRYLVSVLIPMSKGMLTGLVVITFISTWNQYLWPLIVMSDNSKQVAQVGLRFLQGAGMGQTDWGIIMAGAMVTLLPPLLLLVLFRRPLLETFGFQQK